MMGSDILDQFRSRVPDPVPLNDDLYEQDRLVLPERSTAQRQGGFNHRTKLAWAGALVAVVLVAMVVVTDGSQPPSPNPLAVASAAAAQEVPADMTFSRTKILTLGTAGSPPYSYYRPVVTETWLQSDGSGRLRVTNRPVSWPGPRDEARATAANDEATLNPSAQNESDQDLTAREMDDALAADGNLPKVDELSADPQKLRAQLLSFLGTDEGAGVAIFELAAGVVLKPNTRPKVRAAAYELLASLNGVTINSSDVDPIGRSATSASISSSDSGSLSTRRLFFEPSTSAALAFTNTLDQPENFIDSRLLTSVVVMSNDE